MPPGGEYGPMGERSTGCGEQFAAIVADEGGDGRRAGGGGIDHAFDDCASNDGTVGDAGQSGEVSRLGDAEADANGAVSQALELTDVLGQIGRQFARAPVIPETER